MNCSGKHAAMLATCVVNGWDTATYRDAGPPAAAGDRRDLRRADRRAGRARRRRRLRGAAALHLADRAGPRLPRARGRDRRARSAGSPRRSARTRSTSPGTTRDERALLTAIPGAIGKAGAESCYAVALPDGRAFALKTDDGAPRVRPVLMAEALRRSGVDRRGRRRRRRGAAHRRGAAARRRRAGGRDPRRASELAASRLAVLRLAQIYRTFRRVSVTRSHALSLHLLTAVSTMEAWPRARSAKTVESLGDYLKEQRVARAALPAAARRAGRRVQPLPEPDRARSAQALGRGAAADRQGAADLRGAALHPGRDRQPGGRAWGARSSSPSSATPG